MSEAARRTRYIAKNRQEARRIAIHEAGHAVVAIALRLEVKQVKFLFGDRLGGVVYHNGKEVLRLPDATNLDIATKDGMTWASVAFAGIAAEQLAGFVADDVRPSWSRDLLAATHAVPDWMQEQAYDVAQSLVRLNWKAATAIADLLLRQHILDAADVYRIAEIHGTVRCDPASVR